MKPITYWLANPQLLRLEIAKLNEYIDQLNAEVVAIRRRRVIKLVEDILNDKV